MTKRHAFFAILFSMLVTVSSAIALAESKSCSVCAAVDSKELKALESQYDRGEIERDAFVERYTQLKRKLIEKDWSRLEKEDDELTGFWVLHNDKHDIDHYVILERNDDGFYRLWSIDGINLSANGTYQMDRRKLIQQDQKIKDQQHIFTRNAATRFKIREGKYKKSTLTKLDSPDDVVFVIPGEDDR